MFIPLVLSLSKSPQAYLYWFSVRLMFSELFCNICSVPSSTKKQNKNKNRSKLNVVNLTKRLTQGGLPDQTKLVKKVCTRDDFSCINPKFSKKGVSLTTRLDINGFQGQPAGGPTIKSSLDQIIAIIKLILDIPEG